MVFNKAVQDPYGVLGHLYNAFRATNERSNTTKFGEKEFYDQLLMEPSFFNQVPFFPDTLQEGSKAPMPKTLVRYRGLVQDTFDPEFYCCEYALSSERHKRIFKTAKYRDDIEDDAEIDEDSMKLLER